jgi:hypothetical protein
MTTFERRTLLFRSTGFQPVPSGFYTNRYREKLAGFYPSYLL